MVESLPGTEDWTYDIGLNEDILLDHIDNYKPKAYFSREERKYKYPKYPLAAIYFNDGKYKSILCQFHNYAKDQDCGEIKVSPFTDKLKSNADVIKSISGLLNISQGIRGAFGGLTLLFAFSLILQQLL